MEISEQLEFELELIKFLLMKQFPEKSAAEITELALIELKESIE